MRNEGWYWRRRVSKSMVLVAALGLWSLVHQACLTTSEIEEGPAVIVERIHKAWVSGDYERMHANVDYGFRLQETLGPIWDSAPSADQADSVALMRGMFETTMTRYWNSHVAGRSLSRTLRWRGADLAWVYVKAPAPPGALKEDGTPSDDFEWRYRLHRRNGRWWVTQREHLVSFAASHTNTLFPRVLGYLRSMYDRTPTLAEVNANIPALAKRLRSRSFKVPTLPKAK